MYIDDLAFGDWDGAYITLAGTDISSESSLNFFMKGVTGAEEVSVRIQDSSFTDSADVYLTAGTAWARQTVPVASFTGIDLTDVNALHLRVLETGASVYIDELSIGTEDISNPTDATNLKINGQDFTGSSLVEIHNIVSASAASETQDASIEGVRFEYSVDNIKWYTISTDYDTSDTLYSAGWNAGDLIGETACALRAVAQDVAGNTSGVVSVSGFTVTGSKVFVYPNPYYPLSGSREAHFKNIPEQGILNIFTVSGEKVISLKDDGDNADDTAGDGLISWDGHNSHGSTVASGIYLYLVTKDGERSASGKFAVIRK